MISEQAESRRGAAELEAVSVAAYERAAATVEDHAQEIAAATAGFAQAAGAALLAGATVADIADAERSGMARAKAELGKDLLRAVSQAARRRREVEATYQATIRRAARLYSHRDLAEAAGVAHGTIRALLQRASGDETAEEAGHEQPHGAAEGM